MEPKLSRKPLASDPAMASAMADWSAFRPRSFAHAAALPNAPIQFTGCERWRKNGCRDVQRRARVVKIVRMNGDAVGQRGEAGMNFHFRSDDAGVSSTGTEGFDLLADPRPRRGSRSGKRQPEAIQNCFFAEGDHVLWNVLVLR